MIRVISETRVPVKIWATDLEPEAEQQLKNVAGLPFVFKHVAAMPDAHAGKGSTVGTVLATKGAIVPACVGVDIGCGMCALKLPFKIDEVKDLPKLRHSIERAIPTGRFSNKSINESAEHRFRSLGLFTPFALEAFNKKGRSERAISSAAASLGSLGGGNHFIELCYDMDNTAWIMLHSGSRGIGNQLAQIHIDRAKDLMREWFLLGDNTFDVLPSPDLAFLLQGRPEFDAYIHDLMWAQQYATANREEMMDRALREVLYHVGMLDQYKTLKDTLFRVNCHHNYTNIENHFGHNVYVTRKGAVSARAGEWGIIPGSMGAKSFIVKGKGNPESFCSCSHGAGRKMSRTKAKAAFTLADLEAQTVGVECRKDKDVLDEIPGAYKSIDEVMENQADLVEPVFQLKQVLCVKGTE